MTEEKTDQPGTTIEAKKEKSKSNKGLLIFLVIIVVLLIGGLGILARFYYDLKKQNEELQAKLTDETSEKSAITNELNDLLQQYESLETDNETLQAELNVEKEKILGLLEEIKRVKSVNAYQINTYKKELETLRKIMKGYIRQIDSLNTLAQTFQNKYITAKTDYEETQKAYDSLSVEKEELSDKVKIASTLKAVNINAYAINHKSKPVDKVKKVDKLKICFTIRENAIATSGSRTVFIRVSRPDNLVIINSPDNTFNFEGNLIAFTEKREIEYQNSDTDLCIYWKKNQELVPGVYKVDLFADNRIIGQSAFELK